MDMFKIMREACSAQNYKETSNYYYVEHTCEKNGDNIRIHLDYVLGCEKSDEILRFGLCGGCSTCFYHKDHRCGGL